MASLETLSAQLPPLTWLVVAAFALDLLFGDSRGLMHPVIFIGRLVRRLELTLAGLISHSRRAGVLLLIFTLSITALVAVGTLLLAWEVAPVLGAVAAVWLAWSTIAQRTLHRESRGVIRLVEKGKLVEARRALSMIVGRQTSQLDEQGILRACIETLAENTSEGVIAPIFYLFIGGPVLAVLYKALNTLDSMVGYLDKQYREIGWASRRCNDLAIWLPSRLTAFFMALAALPLGLSSRGAFRVIWRDARRHSSPNAGYPEAAAAGALGIQLGGPASYFGEELDKVTLGDQTRTLGIADYHRMVRLMYGTTLMALLLGIGLSVWVASLLP
jgi:adenosylcobinamide-phosphate synthase